MIKRKKSLNCVDITSTLRCNWKCKYCDVVNEPDLDPDMALLEPLTGLIREMLTGAVMSITGGEPGLAKPDVWEWMREISKGTRHVECTTNGTAVERGLHESMDFVKGWRIHGVPHLEEEATVPVHPKDDRLSYVYVLDRNSIDHFHAVAKANRHVTLMGRFIIPKLENPELVPSVSQVKNLLGEIQGMSNVTEKTFQELNLFLSSADLNYDALRKSCSVYPLNPIINLPRMRLHRCCLSISSDWVPLNEETIVKSMSVENQFADWTDDPVCRNCFKSEKLMSNTVMKMSCER